MPTQTPSQSVRKFKDFLGQTSLMPEVKVKYIELFAQKGYLSEEENKALVKELEQENKRIEKFVKTNL